MEPRREAAAWLAGAFAWHAAWIPVLGATNDWDPAYYRSVARHVARGDGDVTGALWNLLWLPPDLPFSAHLHWMPLPAWILVPGMAVSAWGAHLTTALVAATWAPLAWALAQKLGSTNTEARVAAALAATGLAWGPWCTAPDSVALFGALGGAAFLALSHDRVGWAAGVAALAALTRNDGALLGLALALGARGWRGVPIASAGMLTMAAWQLRNHGIMGPGWSDARAATANVLDADDLATLVLGGAAPVDLLGRMRFLATEAWIALLSMWLVVLPLPASAWWLRPERWLRPARAYALGMPLILLLSAPGVALSGSIFRSTAALAPLACAVLVPAAAAVGRWGHAKRGYHPAFLAVVVVAATAGVSLGLGAPGYFPGRMLPADTCALLAEIPAGEAVFSTHPLLVEDHCDRPGVVLIRGMDAGRVADLAERYRVRWALLAPADDGFGPSATVDDADALLPGWVRVSERVWRRP